MASTDPSPKSDLTAFDTFWALMGEDAQAHWEAAKSAIIGEIEVPPARLRAI